MQKAGCYFCRRHQHTRSSLVISPTVGAVAAAAVLALLESDFGRAHYWLICLRVERYLSVTFELAGGCGKSKIYGDYPGTSFILNFLDLVHFGDYSLRIFARYIRQLFGRIFGGIFGRIFGGIFAPNIRGSAPPLTAWPSVEFSMRCASVDR